MKFLLTSSVALICAVSALAAPAQVASDITAVTVYSDRAVVTRTSHLELAAGLHELTFDKLPANLVEQSLQVTGIGTAEATILDVTARRAFIDYTPNPRAKTLENELRELRQQERTNNDKSAALQSQRAAILQLQNTAVSPGGKDSDRPKIEDVKAILDYTQKEQLALSAQIQSLDNEQLALKEKITALEKQLGEFSNQSGRNYKAVTVRVQAGAAGKLQLSLNYTVPGASWTPSYDARVMSGDKSVSLSYYGVVRQNTGEDWKEIALTLSTARPSLGGAAPQLNPWTLDVFVPRQQDEEIVALSAFEVSSGGRQKAASDNGYLSRGVAAPAAPRAIEVAYATVQAGATSASFKVTAPASIPADNSVQKVAITQSKIAADPEYLTTPKQVATAFLTTKVLNSTDYPLLAGAMNVFLDGTFVATSTLRTVMPGEKFDLALGADEGISVKHKTVTRFTEDTGLMSKGKRITYEYLITIQNNKTTDQRVIVADQVPVSRNEKIVVKVLSPSAKEMTPTHEGALKWTLNLKPAEKKDLTIKFTVEHPNDLNVTGLEF